MIGSRISGHSEAAVAEAAGEATDGAREPTVAAVAAPERPKPVDARRVSLVHDLLLAGLHAKRHALLLKLVHLRDGRLVKGRALHVERLVHHRALLHTLRLDLRLGDPKLLLRLRIDHLRCHRRTLLDRVAKRARALLDRVADHAGL